MTGATIDHDGSTPRKRRPASIVAKIIVGIFAALGCLTVAYLAWECLLGPLWHWANEAWWHWILAPFAFIFLLSAPIIPGIVAAPLVAAIGTATGHLWWEAVSYVAELAVIVLGLWAFEPIPGWWPHWPWWLWGAAIVCSAIVGLGSRMLCTVYPVDVPKVRDTFSREWKFNHQPANSPPAPPTLGIAMSGGGIRSAAFNLGVLSALRDNGKLREVDIMSAVSGGSYAMSWYLLQLFYAAKLAEREHKDFKLDDVVAEMFRLDGRFQTYLCRNPRVVEWEWIFAVLAVVSVDWTLGQLLRLFAAASNDVGQFNSTGTVRKLYRDRLQELFQGLPSPDLKDGIANKIGSWDDFIFFRASRQLRIESSGTLHCRIGCHISCSTQLPSSSEPVATCYGRQHSN